MQKQPSKRPNFRSFRNRFRSLMAAAALSLAAILGGCSLPGLGAASVDDGIIIASGSFAERQILSEIVLQMVNHYLPEVETGMIRNLGSTMLVVQALEQEASNISGLMYTGTSLTGELGLEPETDPGLAFAQVVKGYDEQFDMVWFPSYGFDNTYAFMVTADFAAENGLETVSDLGSMADTVRVGVDMNWVSRPGDGYDAFTALYGFAFGNLYPMETGLVYQAVQSGEMDVVLGYSTDGRIDSFDLVLLEDDRNLFPPYDGSPVVTKESLRRWPELETILLKLEDTITSEEMATFNKLSDDDLIEPAVIARRFLEENDYFTGKAVVPLAERPDWPIQYDENWETPETGGAS